MNFQIRGLPDSTLSRRVCRFWNSHPLRHARNLLPPGDRNAYVQGMVYLVRTGSILKDCEKAWKVAIDLSDHIKKEYKEVKDSYFLTNIAGPTDQVHWVVEFGSLADEERFASKAMEDKVYFKAMQDMEGLTSPLVDRLYRRA